MMRIHGMERFIHEMGEAQNALPYFYVYTQGVPLLYNGTGGLPE